MSTLDRLVLRLPSQAWRRVAHSAAVLGCAFLPGCLSIQESLGTPSTTYTPRPPALAQGQYVLDVAGDSLFPDTLIRLDLANRIFDGHDLLHGTWTRADSVDDPRGTRVVTGARTAPHWQLWWTGPRGEPVKFDGRETTDRVRGRLQVGARSASAQLLPLPLDSGTTPFQSLAGWFDPGPRAIVSIRDDDTRDSARVILADLRQRQLMGEFAVVTRRLGTPQFLTWGEVSALPNEGFDIVAHSRLHLVGPQSLGTYAWEVAGAKHDLLAHGLYTQSFAVPGSWKGMSYLDSYAKMRTARGRIAAQFYREVYAWVYDAPRLFPIADSVSRGIGHITADHMALTTVVAILQSTVAQRGYLQLMFHSASADKLVMRAVLDTIAALRDRGLVVVVSSSVALSGRRDGAPTLRAAGGGPIRSSNVTLHEARSGACRQAAASLDSTEVAVDPGCDLTLTLSNPPLTTAVALEGAWRAANAGDSLRLSLADASGRVGQRACAATVTATFCSTRLGVLGANQAFTGTFHLAGAQAGRIWLRGFALTIK